MLPVYWSRIQEVDFDTVPTDGATHELSLFMEDTGWPYVPIDDYIKMWDELYAQPILRHAEGTGTVTIDVQACFQNAHGTGLRREAMLWQKIADPNTVLALAHTRSRPGDAQAGHLHARLLGLPRPVGEQAAANQQLVALVLALGDCAHV